MIRATLYAILFAFAITSVALIGGFFLVKAMVAMLDYFDKEEEEENESHEEPSTTTAPTTTTVPTVSTLPMSVKLRDIEDRIKHIERLLDRLEEIEDEF